MTVSSAIIGRDTSDQTLALIGSGQHPIRPELHLPAVDVLIGYAGRDGGVGAAARAFHAAPDAASLSVRTRCPAAVADTPLQRRQALWRLPGRAIGFVKDRQRGVWGK